MTRRLRTGCSLSPCCPRPEHLPERAQSQPAPCTLDLKQAALGGCPPTPQTCSRTGGSTPRRSDSAEESLSSSCPPSSSLRLPREVSLQPSGGCKQLQSCRVLAALKPVEFGAQYRLVLTVKQSLSVWVATFPSQSSSLGFLLLFAPLRTQCAENQSTNMKTCPAPLLACTVYLL